MSGSTRVARLRFPEGEHRVLTGLMRLV